MSAGAGSAHPLRVLLVNDRPPGRGGGVEVHLARLADGLEQLGHKTSHLRAPPHRGTRRVLDIWDPRSLAALRRAAPSYDVVHIHNYLRELSPSVLRVGSLVPTVVTVHDHRLFRSDRPAAAGRFGPAIDTVHRVGAVAIGRAAIGLMRRHVTRVIATSEELAVALARHGVASRVIPPFAPPDALAWSAPAGSDIVYAGRLARSKGLHVLIDAVVALPEHLGARLVLAGMGPDEDELRGRVPMHAADRVSFVGDVSHDEVAELLRSCRVACLPSIDPEGWPLFVVEAMTIGRPVVATDHPSLRAMLGDGERGDLVECGDAAALRSALHRVLTDDAHAASLGAAGRRFAEAELAPTELVERVVETYREAIAG
jgi:glycosyltransferase involved in cell wall biosynthesis